MRIVKNCWNWSPATFLLGLISVLLLMSVIVWSQGQNFPGGGTFVNGSSTTNSVGTLINVKAPIPNGSGGFIPGAIGDVHVLYNGLGSATQNTLTYSGSGPGPFTAADVGKKIYCILTPDTNTASIWTPGLTTISGYISSTVITYAGANEGAQPNQFCAWGTQDDTPALQAAFNACKSIYYTTNAQRTTENNLGCGIYVPGGSYFFSGPSPIFNGTVTTGTETGVSIIGDGIYKTQFIPLPTVAGPATGAILLTGAGTGQTYKDWSVDMIGLPVTMAVDNTSLISLQASNNFVENIGAFNWNVANGSASYAMSLNGGNTKLYNINIQQGASGSTRSWGFYVQSCSSCDMFAPFLSNTPQNLYITGIGSAASGSGFRIYGGLIDEGSITKVVASQQVAFFGTALTGGTNCLSVDGTSIVRYVGGYCGTFGVGTGGGPTVASGGKLLLTDVDVSAIGAGQYCYNIAAYGGIVDLGGNICTPTSSATVYATGSFVTEAAVTHTYPEPFLPALPTSGTSQTIAAFTPDSAVSVASVTVVSSNTPTCATPPTLSITNGTQTITLTFASSSNISGPTVPTQTVTNNSFPAGTQVTVSIPTTAWACATAPVNMNFSIIWQTSAPAL